MSNQLRIRIIPEILRDADKQGLAIVMVGTFAPIHDGHFDALHAAIEALGNAREDPIESLVLVPNSDEYLRRKLPDYSDEWTYLARIQRILERDSHPYIPTYVDGMSGKFAREKEINRVVPDTIRRTLGHEASKVFMVVGSDQLPSMASHLEHDDNQAICVLRPNYLDDTSAHLALPWAVKALQSNRLIVTERQDMEKDISSTAIRASSITI